MKCAVLSLKPGAKHAFILPLGIHLKAGWRLLVKERLLGSYIKASPNVVHIDTVEKYTLSHGSYEFVRIAPVKADPTPEPEPDPIPAKKNKSMAKSPRKRSKKA